jgi:hypothetical protein
MMMIEVGNVALVQEKVFTSKKQTEKEMTF